MPKSRKPTSVESTRMVRALTHGWLRYAWSLPTSIVVMTSSNSLVEPSTFSALNAGITLSLPSGRFGSSVTPKVGQRGFFPSVRSRESIGKLDRMPPSTSVDASPARLVKLAGREKNGIDIDARPPSAHRGACASPPIPPPVVPRQPHQLPRRHIGDGHHQAVPTFRRQIGIVICEIAEGAHSEALQLVTDPITDVIAAVDPGAAQERNRWADQGHAFDGTRVEKLPVIQTQRQFLDFGSGHLLALSRRGDDRADNRPRGRAGDALRGVARLHQRDDGADEADPFDTAAGENQISALGRHAVSLSVLRTPVKVDP